MQTSIVVERNSTKIGHVVGSKCNLKTYVQNLGYPPTNRGPQNHLFRRLRNLTATLTAYISGTKHDIDNPASALTTTGVSYIVSKRHELWSTNGFKLDRHFYPSYVNCTSYVIAKLRRRTPANGTQPSFVRRRLVSRANNLL